MASRQSAGILPFRVRDGRIEVLVGHMGGPLWARRDRGGWTVIKGELGPGEDAEAAARREFAEETGLALPAGALTPLGDVRQAGGKLVTAWAAAGDIDLAGFRPGTFAMEWPRGSGTMREFPEIDRLEWMGVERAHDRVVTAQREFIGRVVALAAET